MFTHPTDPKEEARLYYWWKNPSALLITLAPHGWIYQNMALIASLEHELIDGIESDGKRVYPKQLEMAGKHVENALSSRTPYNFLAMVAVPNLRKAAQHAAMTQTTANQAFVACALERHRLSTSNYPAALDALVPKYISSIPRDVIGGEALKYRTTDANAFVLYSVGWNETDDGGTPPKAKERTAPDSGETGDWVWTVEKN